MLADYVDEVSGAESRTASCASIPARRISRGGRCANRTACVCSNCIPPKSTCCATISATPAGARCSIEATASTASSRCCRRRRAARWCCIDPSYEDKRDYTRTLNCVEESLKRFATGTYAVWYPQVTRLESQRFPDQLKRAATEELAARVADRQQSARRWLWPVRQRHVHRESALHAGRRMKEPLP